VSQTKLEQLEGTTRATIEVVARVTAVTSTYSRFVHIGAGDEGGRFTLAANTLGSVAFRFVGGALGWSVADLSASDRVVLHVVLNTEAAASERLVLYVDGVAQPHPGWTVAQGAQILLSTNRQLALGNRADGGRSFEGTLYYAAIYTAPLSASVIARHAQILSVDDDAP
jgi:hypothetical protein